MLVLSMAQVEHSTPLPRMSLADLALAPRGRSSKGCWQAWSEPHAECPPFAHAPLVPDVAQC